MGYVPFVAFKVDDCVQRSVFSSFFVSEELLYVFDVFCSVVLQHALGFPHFFYTILMVGLDYRQLQNDRAFKLSWL